MRVKTYIPPVVIAVALVLSTAPTEAAPEHKNLQVLDKNISKDELKAEPTTSSSIYVVSITAIVQYQAAAKAPAASQVGTHISAAA